MKKRVVLMVLAVMLVGTCFAKDFVNKGMIENASPKNSVLIYGFASEPDAKLYYVDEKNNWECVVSTGNRCFSLPPAYKGGKLVVKDSGFISSTPVGKTGSITKFYKIENDEWNVNVPKDKSLYFMGCHSIMYKNLFTMEGIEEIKKGDGLVIGLPSSEEKLELLIKKYELKSLKKLLKDYKKTDWEPLIQERIKELNAEIASKK